MMAAYSYGKVQICAETDLAVDNLVTKFTKTENETMEFKIVREISRREGNSQLLDQCTFEEIQFGESYVGKVRRQQCISRNELLHVETEINSNDTIRVSKYTIF